jgi:small subunit ribosomal protein S6
MAGQVFWAENPRDALKKGTCHTNMTEYELMYLVPTSFTEEEAGTVDQAVAGMLTKASATTLSTKRLGKFRLAYPINGQAHGYYTLVRFNAEPSNIAGLNDTLRLSPDKVLRHLILRAEEAGGDKYDLVQFQEVNVEDRGDRPRRPRTGRPGEGKPEDTKAQKEGVAALEDSGKAAAEGASTVTAEDLEKKIDEALDEKA